MSSFEDTISQFNIAIGNTVGYSDSLTHFQSNLLSFLALLILGGMLLMAACVLVPFLRWIPQRMKLNTTAHRRGTAHSLLNHKDKLGQRLHLSQIVSDFQTGKRLRLALAAKMPVSARGGLTSHEFGVATSVEHMREQLQRSRAALSQSEAKYRGLVEQIPVVVYEADVDDVMTTTYISPVVEELLGYPAQAWIRNPSFWYEHVHPDDRLTLKQTTLGNTSDRMHLTSEYRLIARDGHIVWVRDEGRVIHDAQTGRVYLQGAMLDITARKQAEEQLRYANEHDALTGLYNRAYLEAALNRLQAHPGLDVAFVLVDINALKATNDAHGLATGDALLRQLAQLLQVSVPAQPSDKHGHDRVSMSGLSRFTGEEVVLARIAGDEFVVLLAGSCAAEADRIIDDLESRITQAEAHPGSGQPHLTISLGRATRQPDELLTHTLQRADRAMYQDKILRQPLHALERLLGPRLNVLLGGPKSDRLGLLTHNLQPTDHQNAQQLQELQQVEATYQTFVEQLPVTTYISLPDPQNSILYVSPQIEAILGFSPKEFLRQPNLWTQQIHPQDRERVVLACHLAYEQAKPYEMEYRIMTRSGHTVFIHDEFWPIFNERGQLSYVQGVMMDITARHRAEERGQAFSELGTQLSATTDVSQAADIILQVSDRLLDWNAASISLTSEEDTTLLQTLLMIDTNDGQRYTVRDHETRLLPGSLLQTVLEEGKGVVLNAAEIAQLDLRPFCNANQPADSQLLVPLRNGSRTIGLMSIRSYRSNNTYTEADLETLQALAGHCGGALERIWAEQMLRNQQATLQAISNAVSGRLSLAETLNDICHRVNRQLGTDAVSIVLLSADGDRLTRAGSDGFYESQIPRSFPVVGTHAGQTVLEQRTVHVKQFQFYLPDGTFLPPHPIMRSQRYQSVTHTAAEPNVAYLGVPLLLNNRPVGVLELFRYIGFPTHSQWQSFLQSLAHQVAVAIDSAKLFQDVQRANLELAQAYKSTIEGWSRALDMRDQETEGHTQRVTEMSVRLATAFGFDAEQVKHVRYGALLHDIGKLAIPDHILFNLGPLTQDEWAIMRRHPEYARDMLANVDYLRPAMDIPYAHHERWDGSGYPLGLKGEEIPLAARIFAVVDVWDALRSSRRYREGLPDVAVLDYLRAAAGVHLDPQVVERFLQLLGSECEL